MLESTMCHFRMRLGRGEGTARSIQVKSLRARRATAGPPETAARAQVATVARGRLGKRGNRESRIHRKHNNGRCSEAAYWCFFSRIDFLDALAVTVLDPAGLAVMGRVASHCLTGTCTTRATSIDARTSEHALRARVARADERVSV